MSNASESLQDRHGTHLGAHLGAHLGVHLGDVFAFTDLLLI